jgi:HlyD family secretion protein
MRKRLFVAILVVVIIVIVIVVIRRRGSHNDSAIKVSGTLEITDVQVSFKIPGRVKERLVDEGEQVGAGQVVARLDQSDYLHEAVQRQREVQAQQAALRELEAGSREEEISQAEAAVERTRAELDRAEADFRRQQELFRRDVISARDFDAAKSASEVARARYREAQDQQSLVRKGPRREKIEFARARLEEARAAMAQSETRLAETELVSPVTGLVLSKNIEPGEHVAAGTPIVTIGRLDETWLRAYIAETDLGRVKVGQRALVTTDTYPGKQYEGTITFISPQAEFTPKNVQTEKERVKLVYRIKITIPNPQMELKPGMPADAEILLHVI